MTNRTAVLAYCPPPRFPYAQAFVDALKRFPPSGQMLLFSEHDWKLDGLIRIGDPEQFRQRKVPMGGDRFENPWSVNNAIFFTALRIAQHHDLTHVLYVEADCRFGRPAWDDIITTEFFNEGGYRACCGGTMVCYGPCNHSLAASEKWRGVIAKNERRNFPIATYGAGGAAEKTDPVVLVNGALGIYSMEWMRKLFDLSNTESLAKTSTAWDFEIGKRLWSQVGLEAYDRVLHLDSIYSGYGDKIVSEADRIRMLQEGRVVAVHQIKSNWVGPDEAVMPPEEPEILIENASLSLECLPFQGKLSNPVATQRLFEEATKFDEAAKPTPVDAQTDRRVEIFCVTFARDAEWTGYMLRSIRKFCSGFSGVTVLVPRTDRMKFLKKCSAYGARLEVFDEVPGKGFNDHQAQICMADQWCPDATHVLHVDADCMFTKPTTPDDYFVGWKPVLLKESFERIMARADQPGRLKWQIAAERTLGIPVTHETMCRHPAVHWRGLYEQVRKQVEAVHGKSLREHFLEGENSFPQSVAEFPTLGAWAIKTMAEQYHWIEVGVDAVPEPHLKQFWSYQGISQETKSELEAILR